MGRCWRSCWILGAVGGEDQQSADAVAKDPTTSPAATVSGQPSATAPAGSVPTGVQARVTRVIDGDTIEVDRALDGRATVRYIGVDTPETVAPGQPVGCYGPEASRRNKELVEGKTVFLEKDVSETDRFGRLLRYVYLEDGRMVNEHLVADGFAQVSTFPPDVKHQQRFSTAERQAREAGRGLWGPACAPTAQPPSAPQVQAPTPTNPPAVQPTIPPAPQPTAVPVIQPTQASAVNCHPSYQGGTDRDRGGCIRAGIGDYDCWPGTGNGPNYVIGPVMVVGPDEFQLDTNDPLPNCRPFILEDLP